MFTATYYMREYLVKLGFQIENRLMIPDHPYQIIATRDNIQYSLTFNDENLADKDDGILKANMNVWHVMKRDGIIVDTQQQFYPRTKPDDWTTYGSQALNDMKKVLYRNGL